jgi:hypothetical protein
MLGAVYFFGKLFGVLPVSFDMHCSSMGRHQHDATEGNTPQCSRTLRLRLNAFPTKGRK